MKNRTLSLVIAFPLFIGLSGCANQPPINDSTNNQPLMTDATKTKAQAAGLGAILCTIPCLIFVSDKALCAIAGSACAALGWWAGDKVNESKEQAAGNEAFLDAEIKKTQAFNQEATQHNQKIQQELRVMEEELSKLSSNSKKSQSTKAALVREQSKFKVLAVSNKKMLNNLEAEYAVKKDFLAKNSQPASNDKRLESLKKETEKLSTNIQQLKDSNEQLAKMDNKLSM